MTETAMGRSLAGRRTFLGLTGPLVASLLLSSSRQAEAALRERGVVLHHRHTGETLRSVYFADGRYQTDELRAATHHLRDWRDNTALPVDPKLLDLLWSLRAALDTKGPLQVFCGYRSPTTNAMLRRTRHGAARHSLHMRAMAVDLQVEGRSLRDVRRAAVALQAGGVGYYPRSGFVHVDTGEIRYW
jgi:uncharacterized protein YcbK (DUF882 family)